MNIRFGLYLDRQRGWHPKHRLGELTCGRMGLLDVLETQLGLIRQCASQSDGLYSIAIA